MFKKLTTLLLLLIVSTFSYSENDFLDGYNVYLKQETYRNHSGEYPYNNESSLIILHIEQDREFAFGILVGNGTNSFNENSTYVMATIKETMACTKIDWICGIGLSYGYDTFYKYDDGGDYYECDLSNFVLNNGIGLCGYIGIQYNFTDKLNFSLTSSMYYVNMSVGIKLN